MKYRPVEIPRFEHPKESGAGPKLGFVRRKGTASRGISYGVEYASSLSEADWEAANGPEQVIPIDDTWERVIQEDENLGEPKRFGRVKVTAP